MTNETGAPSQQVDVLLDEARQRGLSRFAYEVEMGWSGPGEPLSGEWAGESVPELLGDLIHKLEKFNPGGFASWEEIVCDQYLDAYQSGWATMSPVEVCPDCFMALHDLTGGTNYEGPSENLKAASEWFGQSSGRLYFPCVDYSFSWSACDLCNCADGGDRLTVYECEQPK